MSTIKQGDGANSFQNVDFSNKISQEMSRQTTNSCQDVDLRYLQIENYINISKKSQFQYLNDLSLLAMVFNIGLDSFGCQNQQNQGKKLFQILEKISASQTIEELLKYNKNKEFLRSYGGFTRKSNNFVFLLINHYKQTEKSQNMGDNHRIKITFLNNQGRVLHICSNMEFNNMEKLNKIIEKHFSHLDMIIVLNKNSTLQQSRKIFNILSRKNGKILSITRSQQKTLNNHYWNGQSLSCFKIKNCGFYTRRVSQDLNYQIIYSTKVEQQMQMIDSMVDNIVQMSQIDDFLIEKLLVGELLSKQMIYKNQFVINCTSWCFNLLTSTKCTFFCGQDKGLLRQNIINRMLRIVITDLQIVQRSQNLNNNIKNININKTLTIKFLNNQEISQCGDQNCWPYLFQTSKKCIVCKASKPKFGCMKCTLKYKKQVHLCVSGCFKLFHLETVRFLSDGITVGDGIKKNDCGEKDMVNYESLNNDKLGNQRQEQIKRKNPRYMKHKKIKKVKKEIGQLYRLGKYKFGKFQTHKLQQQIQQESQTQNLYFHYQQIQEREQFTPQEQQKQVEQDLDYNDSDQWWQKGLMEKQSQTMEDSCSVDDFDGLSQNSKDSSIIMVDEQMQYQ